MRSGRPDRGTFIVPMFLLFDYTLPAGRHRRGRARAPGRARAASSRATSRCSSPAPWPSLAAWCHARCDATAARLEALPADGAHGARQPLAAPVRPGAAAARAALLDLVRHHAHRRLGRAASARAPSSPVICTCARRSGGTACGTKKCRSAIRATGARARHRLVPARDPAGHVADARSLRAAARSVPMTETDDAQLQSQLDRPRDLHGSGLILKCRMYHSRPCDKLRVLVLMHDYLVPPDDVTGHDPATAPWRTEYDVLSRRCATSSATTCTCSA